MSDTMCHAVFLLLLLPPLPPSLSPYLPPSFDHSLISPQRARNKRGTINQNRQNEHQRHPPRHLAAGGVLEGEEEEEAEGAEPVLELEEEGKEGGREGRGGGQYGLLTKSDNHPSLPSFLPSLPPSLHLPSSPSPSTSPTPAAPPEPRDIAPQAPAEGHSER